MQRTMMKSKIHRATVTATQLAYEGSITIDPVLLEAYAWYANGELPFLHKRLA